MKKQKPRHERRQLDRKVNKAAKKIGSKLGRPLAEKQKFGIRCAIETKSRITFSSSKGIVIYNGETDHISFGQAIREKKKRGRNRKGIPRLDGNASTR